MKEAGTIKFQWVPTVKNEADMLTKKLARSEHNKHAARACGRNQYDDSEKMERVMSKGGCQETLSANDLKSAKVVGVKT